MNITSPPLNTRPQLAKAPQVKMSNPQRSGMAWNLNEEALLKELGDTVIRLRGEYDQMFHGDETESMINSRLQRPNVIKIQTALENAELAFSNESSRLFAISQKNEKDAQTKRAIIATRASLYQYKRPNTSSSDNSQAPNPYVMSEDAIKMIRQITNNARS